ncbi:DUF3472 domain-containing protein [Prolixibacteraceae bacterium JC049]|nr:DUF3472 domain-containing protein [Prolixibacteraceae bacterium JC049]
MKIKHLLYLWFVVISLTTNGQNSAVSSHFVFSGTGVADIISMEIRVPSDGVTNYTYYEALGWGGNAGGYAGIQQSPHGRNYIFSIWDNDNQRGPIKAVYTGHGTTTENFGGEGTGLKSWNFQIPWKTDTWYSLNARCWPVGNHTYYGYWIRDGVTGEWKHLVTMDVDLDNLSFPSKNDSFLEDWLNTGAHRRESNLRNNWRRTKTKKWVPSHSGKHTVNYWDFDDASKRSYNYKTNWDAGIGEDATGKYYKMITGGEDTSNSVESGTTFSIPIKEEQPTYQAGAIDQLNANYKGYELKLDWSIIKTQLPQFSYQVMIYDNEALTGDPIFQYQQGAPHHRTYHTNFKQKPGKYYGKFIFIDLFDNQQTSKFSFEIKNTANDIGLIELSPNQSIDCNSQHIDLNFQLANYGSQKLSQFTAKVYIEDALYQTKTLTTNLNRFETGDFTLKNLEVPVNLHNQIKLEVALDEMAKDADQSNNSLSTTVGFKAQKLSIKDIKVLSCSSNSSGDSPEYLFDGNSTTMWHNNWPVNAPLPHLFEFDLGKEYIISGLSMLNRQNNTNGQPKATQLFSSTDGETWTAIKSFEFKSTLEWQDVVFDNIIETRYLKMVINSTINGDNVCSMAEWQLNGCTPVPTYSINIPYSQESEIEVCPNPSKGAINVAVNSATPIQQIDLYAENGQMVQSYNEGIGQLESCFTKDISALVSGIYYLTVTSHKEQFSTRIVKH